MPHTKSKSAFVLSGNSSRINLKLHTFINKAFHFSRHRAEDIVQSCQPRATLPGRWSCGALSTGKKARTNLWNVLFSLQRSKPVTPFTIECILIDIPPDDEIIGTKWEYHSNKKPFIGFQEGPNTNLDIRGMQLIVKSVKEWEFGAKNKSIFSVEWRAARTLSMHCWFATWRYDYSSIAHFRQKYSFALH